MRVNLFALVTLAVLIGCGSEPEPAVQENRPPPPTLPVVVNVSALAGKSPREVDAALGKPSQVIRITGNPEQMPGQYRHYKIPGTSDETVIRFRKGRAVHFTVYLPEPATHPESAVSAIGIDVMGQYPSMTAAAAKEWMVGLTADDRLLISAQSDFSSPGFRIVQAKLY